MLNLTLLRRRFAVCRLDPSSDTPSWASKDSDFFSITKTTDELSVLCTEDNVPSSVKAEKGWQCLKVEGPLDFGLTGILSSLSKPLAEAKIPIFAVSTYDTDYLFIKEENVRKSIELLGAFCKITE